MTTTKKKFPTLTSPAGELKWANIVKPKPNFNKDGEEFTVTLLLSPEQAEPFKKSILAEIAKIRAATPKTPKNVKYTDKLPFEMETDKEGNESGMVAFKFKRKASGVGEDGKAWNATIPIVDAFKTPIVGRNVGGGSLAKIAYQAVPYVNPSAGAFGVSLSLRAVQVLKLVEFNNSAADVFSQEDGYEASMPETETGTPAAEANDDL